MLDGRDVVAGTVLDIVVGDVVAVADVEGVAEEAIVAPDAVDEFVEGAAFDAAPAAASVVAVVLEVVLPEYLGI